MEIYNLQLIECVCVENCSFARESAALRLSAVSLAGLSSTSKSTGRRNVSGIGAVL